MKLSFGKKLILGLFIATLSVSAFADVKYTVQKGDTLYSISKKNSITLDQLRKANNLTDSDVIKIGQTLIIPGKEDSTTTTKNTTSSTTSTTTAKNNVTEYVVVKGDTLYGIAKKQGMKVADLMELNGLNNNSVIKVGQKLKISVATSPIKTTTTTTTTKTTTTTTTTSGGNTTTVTTPIPDTRTYGNSVSSDSNTVWPVKNPTVTTVKGKVNGVQLSAQKNESVTCIREGSVMYIGVYRGYGQIIFVQSKTGIIYAYAGLNTISVKKGDYVLFGKELGTAGVDSLTGKSQITFMVFQNGQSIDPAKAPRN